MAGKVKGKEKSFYFGTKETDFFENAKKSINKKSGKAFFKLREKCLNEKLSF